MQHSSSRVLRGRWFEWRECGRLSIGRQSAASETRMADRLGGIESVVAYPFPASSDDKLSYSRRGFYQETEFRSRCSLRGTHARHWHAACSRHTWPHTDMSCPAQYSSSSAHPVECSTSIILARSRLVRRLSYLPYIHTHSQAVAKGTPAIPGTLPTPARDGSLGSDRALFREYCSALPVNARTDGMEGASLLDTTSSSCS